MQNFYWVSLERDFEINKAQQCNQSLASFIFWRELCACVPLSLLSAAISTIIQFYPKITHCQPKYLTFVSRDFSELKCHSSFHFHYKYRSQGGKSICISLVLCSWGFWFHWRTLVIDVDFVYGQVCFLSLPIDYQSDWSRLATNHDVFGVKSWISSGTIHVPGDQQTTSRREVYEGGEQGVPLNHPTQTPSCREHKSQALKTKKKLYIKAPFENWEAQRIKHTTRKSQGMEDHKSSTDLTSKRNLYGGCNSQLVFWYQNWSRHNVELRRSLNISNKFRSQEFLHQ